MPVVAAVRATAQPLRAVKPVQSPPEVVAVRPPLAKLALAVGLQALVEPQVSPLPAPGAEPPEAPRASP